MNLHPARRRNYTVHPLPLVAMIDVVLFLLLYFIIAGSMVPAEIQLSASLSTAARGAGGASDLTAQVLYVERIGEQTRFRIGGQAVTDRGSLAAVIAALPKDPGVVIRVSDDAPVWATAMALQVIRDAGFRRVSYVAAGQ
ncbi:MAG: ExbD/TolR family protein [Phycisphaerales bacterium]